ncbi:MAG: hypothetical protein H6632_15940 [Anaerolineales bacterium]|nr:hypothetical protein [Anaerolineales bacterium]
MAIEPCRLKPPILEVWNNRSAAVILAMVVPAGLAPQAVGLGAIKLHRRHVVDYRVGLSRRSLIVVLGAEVEQAAAYCRISR